METILFVCLLCVLCDKTTGTRLFYLLANIHILYNITHSEYIKVGNRDRFN